MSRPTAAEAPALPVVGYMIQPAMSSAYFHPIKEDPAYCLTCKPLTYRDDAQAALDKLTAEMDTLQAWQPISTAPKDGTSVLIANDSPGSIHPREAYYVLPEHRYEHEPTHAGWWRLAGSSRESVHGRTPTHWMPLPQSPAPLAEKEQTR